MKRMVDVSKLDFETVKHIIGLLEIEIDSVGSEIKAERKLYKKDKIDIQKYTGLMSFYKPMLKAYKKMFKFLNELDNNTEVVE